MILDDPADPHDIKDAEGEDAGIQQEGRNGLPLRGGDLFIIELPPLFEEAFDM
jgi:hypothetical protein